MPQDANATRLVDKSTLHTIQVELQQGYNLSPVEAQVLAQRVEQLIDEQTGSTRQQGQISYQAIAADEPPGKPLSQCRKVSVHLTLAAEEDMEVWAEQGSEALRRLRAHRLIYEALLQGYLDGLGPVMTPAERALLPFSATLITLEIGMRFLTDHLAGDTYFRIRRPGQNLDRCRTQFRLVEHLERLQPDMERLAASRTIPVSSG